MERGWVRIYRKIQDNEIWLDEKFSRGQALIDMILLAQHKPKTFLVRGNRVDVQRGQVAIAESTLASRWQWSRDKVRAFLTYLEKSEIIIQQKNRLLSTYSIVNYEDYQTTDQTTEKQQKNHKQECKEGKEKRYNGFKPPSLQEVTAYCNERDNGISPQKFIDHYEASGWMRGKNKIKCWKACVRTWEGNRKEEQSTPLLTRPTRDMGEFRRKDGD